MAEETKYEKRFAEQLWYVYESPELQEDKFLPYGLSSNDRTW